MRMPPRIPFSPTTMLRQCMRKLVCGAMVWLHLLLLSSAPLLHAHSAEPIADPEGVHLFVPSLGHTHTMCAITGEVSPICTAEVGEGRGLDDPSQAFHVLLPWLHVSPAAGDDRQSFPRHAPESVARPHPSRLRASPQAP
ncbi:MAG: hypothetical protein JNK75_11890 [Betaproteobacteria bacterium]|nr:hypothetical protein [Betaproteobacteria bacterium]